MASVSGDSSGVKRPREETEGVEGRAAKRARLSGVDAVHKLVAISEESFFTKSVADIMTVVAAFQQDIESGGLAGASSDKIKLIRREMHIIEDRIAKSSHIEQQEKEQLFGQIKAILPLLKKSKETGLPEAIQARVPSQVAASIRYLWSNGDIKITENKELSFSDAIASEVDNDFLQKVFTLSVDAGFKEVQLFEFSRYPKLNAETPALLYTYCPQVFDTNPTAKNYGDLAEPRFCDHTLIVQDVEIPINKWYLTKRSNYLQEFISLTSPTVLPLPKHLDAGLVIDSLNWLDATEGVSVFFDGLFELLEVATWLDMPLLIEKLDRTLASYVENEGRTRLADGVPDEKAIEFIQLVKDKFVEALDIEPLPTSRKCLNDITSRLFARVCLQQANFAPLEDISDEELVAQFAIISNTFNSLGPKNVLTDFSLFEQYPDLHGSILSQHRSDAALEQYQKLLETCIRYNPRDKRALEVLAYCHQWGSDPDKWSKAKDALVRLKAVEFTAETRCTLAELLFRESPDEAIQLLQTAIEMKPTDSLIYCTLAHLLKQSGKIKEAISLLRQFDDTAKDYSELLAGDPFHIRLYALYLRAIDGEKVTDTALEAIGQPPFHQGERRPIDFVGSAAPVIVQRFSSREEVLQGAPHDLVAHLAAIQKWKFRCTYPLLVDISSSFPPEIKGLLFS